jgi:hypothetical protein
VLAPIWMLITVTNTGGGALCGSTDGPRPSTEARVSARRAERPRLVGRWSARAPRRRAHRQHLDLTSGRDPIGEERSWCC